MKIPSHLVSYCLYLYEGIAVDFGETLQSNSKRHSSDYSSASLKKKVVRLLTGTLCVSSLQLYCWISVSFVLIRAYQIDIPILLLYLVYCGNFNHPNGAFKANLTNHRPGLQYST